MSRELFPFIPKHDRKKCAECKKPMPFVPVTKKPNGNTIQAFIASGKEKTGEYYYGGYGNFCTLTCAARFANRIVANQIFK
jgi:hypothetical protein